MALTTFLQSATRGSSGQWLTKWKDAGKVVVWLHTEVSPTIVFTHPFMSIDVVEDKETGRPKQIMRYWKFVSPDPEPVHRNQFFRGDGDLLKVPPDRDPFLILREWLRRAEHLGLDQPIFKWTNPKNNEHMAWTRGELSGLVKRGKQSFTHSLDTKIEYIFALVRNDAPNEGVLLARETQLVGQKVAEVIRQRQDEYGDEGGDPQIHPYSFVWSFDKTQGSPMNMYKVWKGDHELTDEIWAQISSESPPDPSEFAQFRDGDLEKTHEAMKRSAAVELPLDEIFSPDPAVRLALVTGKRAATRPAATRTAPQVATTVARPRPNPAATIAAHQNGAQRAASTSTTAASSVVGRRRKKAEPAPQPPQEERVPCEDCNTLILVTATKCPKCGAEYEVDDEPVVAASQEPAKAPPQQQSAAPSNVSSSAYNSCFMCGGQLDGDSCPKCGIVNDDIPF